ncbi:LysM peptidoglycan-binding domain-containing protein [Phosphitispora sp. TUW77]|uniref:cell division suppressor protein YneA n=1 Tax=Phosphitispora sp. TUW77 TaxID=3152361 RepID=UPI003AB5EC92
MTAVNKKNKLIKEKRKKIKFNPFKFSRMLCLTLILLAVMSPFYKTSASGFTGKEYQEVVVCQGDTLWEISKKYSHNENLQKVVYEIRKLNDMKHSNIYPGQKIKIPLN